MLTNNIIQQQQLLAAIPVFEQFIKEHINDYVDSESRAIQKWLKGPYGVMCRDGGELYSIRGIAFTSVCGDKIKIDLDMRVLKSWPNSGVVYHGSYNFPISHTLTLEYLAFQLWDNVLHVMDYVDNFDEFISKNYEQPAVDFVKYYRAMHKELII
jgi:hypothetical protein